MELVLAPALAASSVPDVRCSLLKVPNLSAPRLLLAQRCRRSSLACQCVGHETTNDDCASGFSALSRDIPWKNSNVWMTMALYVLNLHIPFGVCGLSVAAYAVQMPVLDPQTEALSLLVIQITELAGVLLLLGTTAVEFESVVKYFVNKDSKERNWILATTLSLGCLILLVFASSFLVNGHLGFKDAGDSFLREMISSSSVAKSACVIVYCLITPLLEESVYRGFLLTSLASTMSWQKAVLFSSFAFSAAHCSLENFVQLFVIGCVLGCCYCWTGKLYSSFTLHSLYNAMILIMTALS